MPIYLKDLDVTQAVAGLSSALIVPCYMCPAVTASVKARQPFLQFFRSFLKSPPFEQSIRELQNRLQAAGVETSVFTSNLVYHWFLCMWPAARRRKLKRAMKNHDAAIVLGCDSATETVRELVPAGECTVIQGMEVTGYMNARLRFAWPGHVLFDSCKIIPITRA